MAFLKGIKDVHLSSAYCINTTVTKCGLQQAPTLLGAKNLQNKQIKR